MLQLTCACVLAISWDPCAEYDETEFIRKIYPQNLSAKSIRKIYPQSVPAFSTRPFMNTEYFYCKQDLLAIGD